MMSSHSQSFAQRVHLVLLLIGWQALCAPLFVYAQAAKSFRLNPLSNFCARWWSHSTVKNDILYIDSGVQKWNGTDIQQPILGINSYILTVPLNFSWDWKTNIIINAQAKNQTTPSTGTLPPSQIRGYMFQGPPDDPNVYVYGGTTYMGNQSFEAYAWPDSSAYPLWGYKYGPGYPWQQFSTSQAWMPNHGSAAEATDQGLAFYLNGQIDWGTSSKTLSTFKSEDLYIPLDGMVVLDLKAQSSRNISTPRLRGNAARVGGSMEYLSSVGGQGIFIAIGGQIQPELSGLYANASQGRLLDLAVVDVFDLDSYLTNPSSNGSWYRQNTTGEIPAPRIDFCTVAISAPDNSSHHIYLYGGRDPISGTAFDDVVVLTIPSFTWINVWPIGEAPRWGHNCHIAGKRQMITVGGNITNGLECDWEVKGVAVWDMTSLTWGSVFMSNLTNFQVPTKFLNVTGGTRDGRATVKDPALGWTEQGLKTVFATPRRTTQFGDSTGSGSSAKNNTGAIVGGVIGGIVGLALLALASLFYLRHRRKKRGPHELHNTPASPQQELGTEKSRFELQAVNENNPAELASPYATHSRELESPREAVEADRDTAARGVELPGTNVVAGGNPGVPFVRTPGDDLPEQPVHISGLRMPNNEMTRPGVEQGQGVREEGNNAAESVRATQAIQNPKDKAG